MDNNTKTVARINEVSILLIENGEKYVPIRPICEILNIDHKNQRTKIKSDEILNSVGVLKTSTGSDGKQYEMYCLPYKFVFGWLFTINPKNVKPEAQEAVLRYKLECYDALFKHFTEQSQFLEERAILIEEKVDNVERIRSDFKDAQSRLKVAREDLNKARRITFEEWKANRRQLKLDFTPTEDFE